MDNKENNNKKSNSNNKRILLSNEFKYIPISEDINLNYYWIGKEEESFKGIIKFLHEKANIKSRISVKVLLYDKASFDLEGIVNIPKGIIGVDTFFKAEVLILSDTASARIVPSLEILENDVKAGHSAVIKELNGAELYYLESRGLSKNDARDIMVESFLRE